MAGTWRFLFQHDSCPVFHQCRGLENRVITFLDEQMVAVYQVLADTGRGLRGERIERLLQEIESADVFPDLSMLRGKVRLFAQKLQVVELWRLLECVPHASVIPLIF